MRSIISLCTSLLIASLLAANCTDAFADEPETKPTTQPAKLEAKISPDAQKVLDDVKAAYAKLNTLLLAGTATFDSDIAGKKDHVTDQFTASFQAPNKFRHEMKGNMLAGSTGEKAYVLSIEDNAYVQKDAPKDRVAGDDAPKAIWDVVAMQNPALAMALSTDASRQLVNAATAFAAVQSRDASASDIEKATKIEKAADTKLGEKSFQTLKLSNSAGDFTYLLDPDSHLLRQLSIDQTAFMKKVGQPDVKQAQITVDYETTTPDAKVADNQFAWTPPANARELTAGAGALARDDDNPAAALVGKAAPDFKLADLKGKDVKLSELKGSVVIVDFWATWCGPCVESLPHLQKLYQAKKDTGLKVVAVSVDEDKAKVPPFVADKKLTFTVVIDSDEQKAAETYMVQGIPQTVVIGKDGKVAKVFVGFGPGSEEQLQKVVDEQMAK